jgi:hypothetical protein
MYPREKMKDVFTIVKPNKENVKNRWVRVGIGFVNGDGSIAVQLDATPTNGTLHIRDYAPREWREKNDRATTSANPPIFDEALQ